jgi:hypothetical protein
VNITEIEAVNKPQMPIEGATSNATQVSSFWQACRQAVTKSPVKFCKIVRPVFERSNCPSAPQTSFTTGCIAQLLEVGDAVVELLLSVVELVPAELDDVDPGSVEVVDEEVLLRALALDEVEEVEVEEVEVKEVEVE